MSDQLSRIEQMLLEMREKMATKEEVDALHEKVEKLPKREEFDALGVSTDLIATGLEDKTEAGYVVLESLFKGLEDRINQRFDKMEALMLEGFKQTAERFSQVSDIMRSWVYKQNLVDRELEELKKKVDKLSGE